MWVLTREVNEYDQYGAYFQTAWINKPTFDDLNKFFKNQESKELIDHILKGGGRIDVEYEWYWLNQIKSGETI